MQRERECKKYFHIWNMCLAGALIEQPCAFLYRQHCGTFHETCACFEIFIQVGIFARKEKSNAPINSGAKKKWSHTCMWTMNSQRTAKRLQFGHKLSHVSHLGGDNHIFALLACNGNMQRYVRTTFKLSNAIFIKLTLATYSFERKRFQFFIFFPFSHVSAAEKLLFSQF